ncbi:MAG TPA: lysophospholipid acyltransferase family protein [Vicinamibacterales bacterium]|nr:lysophospholipid acyltransferase family protein [Vicinamibacterales bacterium]
MSETGTAAHRGRAPVFHWLRTVFFLIPSIAVYTIVLGSLSLLSGLVDRSGRIAHACARIWSWLILATTGVIVDCRGLERVERGRTYVFVSNHQSIYDIPVIFASLPFQLRIIAKESLGRFPFLGWHLRRSGHLLVDRSRPDRAGILRRWKALVGEGLSLIVFPEGTRSPDGRLGAFKAGSFLLAIEAGLPIVPLTVSGTIGVMTKGHLTTRPGRVRLVVHEPISTTGYVAAQARDLAARVRSIVEAPLLAADPRADVAAAGGSAAADGLGTNRSDKVAPPSTRKAR